MNNMKAMVLAAGKGSRLSPLTGEVPKPLAPVAGKPIIGHIFELLSAHGIDEVHVNVHHLADSILDFYGERTTVGGSTINFTREEELLGTAGSVKRLADRFDETFLVIMGDALTDADLGEVVSFHKEREALATLALTPVEDTRQFGVVDLDSVGNVRDFQEKPDPQEAVSNLANTGIYVLEPEVLEYVPEDTVYDFAKEVFPAMLAAGEKIAGFKGDFYWSDIGTLSAYQQAQHDALSGKVKVRIPGERLEGTLWVDGDSRLHPTASFENRVVLGRHVIVGREASLSEDTAVGDDCRVSPGATLKRSVLLPGASVGDGAYLEDCLVGPGYEVRPGDDIRGEALVQDPR
jgi:mannose-1-phosphate guanylyltransferase